MSVAQIKEILHKIDGIPLSENPKSFNLLHLMYHDISGKERIHSKMLAGLLNPNENHKLGRKLLESFLKEIGVSMLNFERVRNDKINIEIERPIHSEIYGTVRYIDILIYWEYEGAEGKHAVIIENKLHEASNQSNQLMDYYNAIKNSEKHTVERIVYMPYSSEYQHSEDIEGIDGIRELIENFDSDKIISWLNKAMTDDSELMNSHMLNQYKEFMECIGINAFRINTIMGMRKVLSLSEMKKLESISCSHTENYTEKEMIMLEKLKTHIKTQEWCQVRFLDIIKKLPFGKELKKKYGVYGNERYFIELYFEPYKFWCELWIEGDVIELWIASKEKYDDPKIDDVKFSYWGYKKKRYYFKFEEDLIFEETEYGHEKLCSYLLRVLNELKRYEEK